MLLTVNCTEVKLLGLLRLEMGSLSGRPHCTLMTLLIAETAINRQTTCGSWRPDVLAILLGASKAAQACSVHAGEVTNAIVAYMDSQS